jgi:hypothetical protein
LQIVNEELHAKNIKFEAEMKEYKEKTALELQQIKIFANIDKFLMNSKCTSNINEKLYLMKLLGFKIIVTTLLYRGSKHGWNAKDFH